MPREENGCQEKRNGCRDKKLYFGATVSAARPLGGGGVALRYQMATHCQTAARSGSCECQNIEPVNFELTRIVACKMRLFSLYFVKYIMCITLNGSWSNWSYFCIQFCIEKV